MLERAPPNSHGQPQVGGDGLTRLLDSRPSLSALIAPMSKLTNSILFALMLGAFSLTARAEVSLAEVSANLAEVEQRPAGDAMREALLPLLEQTKAMLETEAAHRDEAARFGAILETGPASLRKLREELARFKRQDSGATAPLDARSATAAELQGMMEAASNERSALETKLNTLAQSDRALAARPAEISQAKTEVLSRIAAIEVAMAALAQTDSTELSRVRREMLEAEFAARQAELDALNAEQLSQSTRLELHAAKHRLAEARLARASAQVGQYEQLLLERRAEELHRIQDDAGRALQEATHAPESVRLLAADNVRFGKMLSQMLDDQARAVQARTDYGTRRRDIALDFDRARQRMQLAGSSSRLGRILVDQRRELPDLRALERLSRESENKISSIGLSRIEIDEQLTTARAELQQPAVDFASLDPDAAPLDDEGIRRARSLLTDQVELLESLVENHGSARRSLDAADFELQQLVSVVTDYQVFLDERLLWLPNAPPLSRQFIRDLVAAGHWLLRPATWRTVFEDVARGGGESWPRALLLVLLAVFVVRLKRPFRARLRELAELAREPQSDQIRYTALALGLSVMLSLAAPLLMFSLASLLNGADANSDFSLALGQALGKAGWLLLGLSVLLQLLGPGGVAITHFDWPVAPVRSVRKQFIRAGCVFIPAYSLASVFEWDSTQAFQSSFSRLCLLLAMLAVIAFVRGTTCRNGAVFAALAARAFPSFLIRWRGPCVVLAYSAPGILAVLSALGYQYAALELSAYFVQTALLLIGAVVVYNLALRWLRMAQARMAAELEHERAAGGAANEESEGADNYPVDLATMGQHSRMIFRNVVGWSVAIGLFWIWREVLPALGALDQITLWEVQIKDAAGVVQAAPITLSNAVFAALIAAISVLAARNMPSLLEIAVLRRVKMHGGSRYAINMLMRYLIIAIGVSLTLSTLGLRWSQVQWLVAALSVGLGFGLQEIFANFISGLILLFERPIRVGDFVTIGELTGRVSRIQIRATTIADADNREIIVPNRNFITERFVNWTLSDAVTRLLIPVGIAYGSDLKKALKLLLEVADAHSKVLCDPSPTAVVQGFGDSAVMLELQVYAREVPHRIDIRHQINSQIYETFRANGIEIPFPQRDLHLRTISADWVNAVPAAGSGDQCEGARPA